MNLQQKLDTTQLIIFDFDGTLAQSIKLGYEIYTEVNQKYHLNLNSDLESYRTLLELNPAQIILKLRLSPWKVKAVAKELRISSGEKLLACPPYPDTAELLSILKPGRTLAIVTSNYKSLVEQYLHHHHLASFFDLVIGSESSYRKTTKIKTCLTHYHVSPNQVLLIGDAVSDIRDSHALNIQSVILAQGIHTYDRLSKEHPDWLFHSTQELLVSLQSPTS